MQIHELNEYNLNPSEGDWLIVDTGKDTAKVGGERFAYKTDIDVLSNEVSKVIKSNNGYRIDTLWTGSMYTGGDSAALTNPIANYDYIDIYTYFLGATQIYTTDAVTGDLFIRNQNIADETSSNFLVTGELKLILSAQSVGLEFNHRWRWSGSSSSSAAMTSNDSEMRITKIVGRKCVVNQTDTEVEDIRVGADGTVYNSAGEAVRDQVGDLDTRLSRYETIFTADVDQSVSNWLDEHPEATTTVQDGSITREKLDTDVGSAIDYVSNKTYYNSITGSSVLDNSNFTEATTLWLPEGHSVQGMTYYNGYIYIAHHENDEGVLYVSKYEDESYDLIDTIPLESGIHGNSMDVYIPDEKIYIADNPTMGFYLVDIPTFTYEKKALATGLGIESIAIKRDGSKFGIRVGSSASYEIYTKYGSAENWIRSYQSDSDAHGNKLFQDACANDNFIYQLVSNNHNNVYNPQYIQIIGWNGNIFGNLYLPNTEIELEGIAYRGLNVFYIVDFNGNLYTLSPNAEQTTPTHFSQSIGTYKHGLTTQWDNYTQKRARKTGNEIYSEVPYEVQLPYLFTPASSMTRMPPSIDAVAFNGFTAVIGTDVINSGGDYLIHPTVHVAFTTLAYDLTFNYQYVSGDHVYRLVKVAVISPFETGGIKIVSQAFTTTDSASDIKTKLETFFTNLSSGAPKAYASITGRTQPMFKWLKMGTDVINMTTWVSVPAPQSSRWVSV